MAVKNIAIVLDNARYLNVAIEKAAALGPEKIHCLLLTDEHPPEHPDGVTTKEGQEIAVFVSAIAFSTVKDELQKAQAYVDSVDAELVMIHRPLLRDNAAELPFIKGMLESMEDVGLFLFGHNRWNKKPKLLAALDITDGSDKQRKLDDAVMAEAQSHARLLGAKLHAVSVIPQSRINYELDIVPPNDVMRAKGKETLADLKNYLQAQGCGEQCEAHVDVGVPAMEIMRTAKELNAAFVVVGNHGRGGLAGWLIGNTVNSILDNIGTDVLVIRPSTK